MCQDQALVCRQCGERFVFSLSEQQFYEKKGFVNKPKRCAVCRGSQRALQGTERPQKKMYGAICAECGTETQLPFKPRGDKPVYCYACLLKQRKEKK